MVLVLVRSQQVANMKPGKLYSFRASIFSSVIFAKNV